MVSDFIRQLPKAELHLHLEGTIEPDTLLNLSRRHDAEPLTRESVGQLYSYPDFFGFLQSFKNITDRLRTPDDYELITYRMIERLAAEGVVHAEVTCSVGVCLWRGMDFDAIFEGMERGRERGERDFGVSLLWIFDAVRQFGVEAASAVLDVAIRFRDRDVVGFGIGGDERKAAPEMFRDLYAKAKDHGLRLTAHAGEAAGPESIWGALNIGAERIGHGLSAWQDPELLDLLAERQVPIEICITSNLRTGCCSTLDRHPVRMYFDRGMMLTLNSDDPAMFASTLEQEYELAQQAFGFTDEHLRELARNSIEASFLPPERKLALLNSFDSAVHHG
jgi:adenosine deaminase/aminodeoxyfutalosine deaminase